MMPPDGWRHEVCRCGAKVVWAEHASGDFIVIDDAPAVVTAQACLTKTGLCVRLVDGWRPHVCDKGKTIRKQEDDHGTDDPTAHRGSD